ncbi:MAG: hypothetical protein ACP5G6_05830, partial [Conexivisphaera sp.]
WGIETSYRAQDGFEARTCSRSHTMRIAYFMLSIMLYNSWAMMGLLDGGGRRATDTGVLRGRDGGRDPVAGDRGHWDLGGDHGHHGHRHRCRRGITHTPALAPGGAPPAEPMRGRATDVWAEGGGPGGRPSRIHTPGFVGWGRRPEGASANG